MRSTTCIALLGAAVLAAGCDAAESKPSAGVPTERSLLQFQKVGKETREAVQAAKDYAYALRAELVTDMQDELAAANRTVQQLNARIQSGGSEARADAQPRLAAVRDAIAQLSGELEKAQNATEAAWAEAQAGVKKAHEDLKESVAKARTWLSEKIAP